MTASSEAMRATAPVAPIPAPLSPSRYLSEEQLSREREVIFARNWMFAAPLHKVSEPGTVYPVVIAGVSIVLTGDANGVIRAFHNVCSHRACELVSAPQTARRTIVCPYHAWVYKIDGSLHTSGDFAGASTRSRPAIASDRLDLKPLAVDTWLDFVFVCLSPPSVSLDDALLPITGRVSGLDLTELRHHTTMEYRFEANWKLIVENFLESYHVPFLHHVLDTYSPASGRYQIQLENGISGIGTTTYEGAGDDGQRLPRWPSHGDVEQTFAEYFNVFPTFLVGVMPDHLFAWSLEALSPHRTVETLHFYFIGDAAEDDKYAALREQTLQRWKQVNDEDWGIVQNMHRGLSSPGFTRALLSPVMERNIIRFQQQIYDATPTTPVSGDHQ